MSESLAAPFCASDPDWVLGTSLAVDYLVTNSASKLCRSSACASNQPPFCQHHFRQQHLTWDYVCRAHSGASYLAQDECSQDVEELRQQLDEACGTIANLQDENDHLTALIPELEERIKSTEAQVSSRITPICQMPQIRQA